MQYWLRAGMVIAPFLLAACSPADTAAKTARHNDARQDTAQAARTSGTAVAAASQGDRVPQSLLGQ